MNFVSLPVVALCETRMATDLMFCLACRASIRPGLRELPAGQPANDKQLDVVTN